MRAKTLVIALVAVLLTTGFVIAPAAFAGGRGGSVRIPHLSASSLRQVGKHLNLGRSSKHMNLGGLSGLGDLLNRGGRSHRGGGWNGLDSFLGRDSFYGHGRNYDSGYGYPEAYRDAAIANAVAGVVGTIVTGTYGPYGSPYGSPYGAPYGGAYVAGPGGYVAPGPYAVPYAAPRAVAVAPVAPAPTYVRPSGRYETERVLVKPGRYEEYQVSVPDTRDEQTGDIIKGHTETRQRYVPEVWEERQVWVTP